MPSAEYKQRVLESSYFPVEKRHLGEDQYAIVRTDNSTQLSTVSKRYTLVENRRIFQPFVDTFGIDSLIKFYKYTSGRNYYAEFETGREFNLGKREGEQDIVKERLIVQNSYDKTKAFAFMLGAFRLVCTNGLYTGQAVLTYRKIHVGDIPVNQLIQNVLSNYRQNTFATWEKFANMPMTVEQEKESIKGFNAFEIRDEATQENRIFQTGNMALNGTIRNMAQYYVEQGESLNNPRNAWGLFNQINRAISYSIRGKSQTSKRILANKRAEDYLLSSLSLN